MSKLVSNRMFRQTFYVEKKCILKINLQTEAIAFKIPIAKQANPLYQFVKVCSCLHEQKMIARKMNRY